MKQPQYKRQDVALQPLTQKLDGLVVPNPNRWKHEELETRLEGFKGYGKLGYGDVTSWARGTTKAIRPQVDLTQSMPKPKPIHNMRELRAAAERIAATKPQPVEVITACCITPFSPDDWAIKVASKCLANALQLEEFAKGKVERTGAIPKVGKKAKAVRFTPGITGLDSIRKVKVEPMADWERDKQDRSDLMLYWLTLRQIYRLLYG